MEAITEAIENLIEFIELIWDFIGNMIHGLTIAFDILGRILVMAVQFLGTWPAYIQVFGVLTIIISVIYFLVGRETGKSNVHDDYVSR